MRPSLVAHPTLAFFQRHDLIELEARELLVPYCESVPEPLTRRTSTSRLA